MFILFIDDFLMDVIQLYSLPALHPSFISLPEAPRSANLLRQSNNFYARRAPVTQSSVSTRGGCLTRAFIFLWREIQAIRRARSQKTKDTKGQPKREMRTFQSQSQRGAFSTLHSLSSSAMSPLRTASITFAALLILTIPVCQSKSVSLFPYKQVYS